MTTPQPGSAPLTTLSTLDTQDTQDRVKKTNLSRRLFIRTLIKPLAATLT